MCSVSDRFITDVAILISAAGDVWRRVLLGQYCRERLKLECVIKFCYLGDTLNAGGGANQAAIELKSLQ